MSKLKPVPELSSLQEWQLEAIELRIKRIKLDVEDYLHFTKTPREIQNLEDAKHE